MVLGNLFQVQQVGDNTGAIATGIGKLITREDYPERFQATSRSGSALHETSEGKLFLEFYSDMTEEELRKTLGDLEVAILLCTPDNVDEMWKAASA